MEPEPGSELGLLRADLRAGEGAGVGAGAGGSFFLVVVVCFFVAVVVVVVVVVAEFFGVARACCSAEWSSSGSAIRFSFPFLMLSSLSPVFAVDTASVFFELCLLLRWSTKTSSSVYVECQNKNKTK